MYELPITGAINSVENIKEECSKYDLSQLMLKTKAENDGFVILSCFDGISCGQLAMLRANIPISAYYASEIDKNAIRVTKHHFPNTIHLGDIRNISFDDLEHINPDIIIGGSPCTNLSFAGKRQGMSTKENIDILTLEQYLQLKEEGFEFIGQSYLFWEYVRLLRYSQSKTPNVLFLLENVVMTKKWQNVFEEALGVKAILIDSALVSAQQRKRLYFTNIPNIEQPKDRGIKLLDILESDEMSNPSAVRTRYINKGTIIGRRLNSEGKRDDYNKNVPITQCLEVRATNRDKSNCITTVGKDNVLTSLPIGRHRDAFKNKLPFRYYTTKELCRLQTLPDDYFTGLASDNQALKLIGNSWTISVIEHLFKNI